MLLSILSLCLSLFLLSGPSYAAVFNIPSGNVTALIAAINTANANGQENTINLEAGTYTLTAVNNNTSGPNGLPVVSSRMAIIGAGPEQTVIVKDTGAPVFRILHVAASGDSSRA